MPGQGWKEDNNDNAAKHLKYFREDFTWTETCDCATLPAARL